jgi:diaminopropionate ammonia-lyase
VIFVYDGVPEDQIAAIARHGADIVHVAGVYEAAVAECRARAAKEGWTIVSDTSWPGYDDIPARVMQGYTAMAAEAFDQMPAAPTHVLLQAGVGGMAAAVAAHAEMRFKAGRPRIVVVEPHTAACLMASARAGCLTDSPLGERTIMGRLECSVPSPIAWEILGGLAEAFVAVTDVTASRAVRWLAARGIETSPSGAAGVAGLLALLEHPSAVASLGLGRDSRVLAFVTEAATADDRARRARPEWSEAAAAMDEVP